MIKDYVATYETSRGASEKFWFEYRICGTEGFGARPSEVVEIDAGLPTEEQARQIARNLGRPNGRVGVCGAIAYRGVIPAEFVPDWADFSVSVPAAALRAGDSYATVEAAVRVHLGLPEEDQLICHYEVPADIVERDGDVELTVGVIWWHEVVPERLSTERTGWLFFGTSRPYTPLSVRIARREARLAAATRTEVA